MPLFSGVSSLWYNLTTNDRHAHHRQSNGTRADGSHARPANRPPPSSLSLPTSQPTHPDSHPDGFRPSPLQSISRPSSTAGPYVNHTASDSNVALNGIPSAPGTPLAQPPFSPYSPGLRSSTAAAEADAVAAAAVSSISSGSPSIALQDFSAGGTPQCPSVRDSWRRIDRWVEERYPELYDQLAYGATSADVEELEKELSCHFPRDVKESLAVHDGQERGGRPTGIVFGAALLDCEEITQEWDLWRTVAAAIAEPPPSSSANGGSAKKNGVQGNPPPSGSKQHFLQRQHSRPEGAVQRVYASTQWIPLAKDFQGNNIAIDLAPASRGQWGQIIIFGSDYDTKYVVAKSWSSFMAMLADDIASGEAYVDDEGELCLRFHGERGMAYFDVLKARVDRRCGKLKRPMGLANGKPPAGKSPAVVSQ